MKAFTYQRVDSATQAAAAAFSPGAKIIAGGKADGSKGYFISPTIVETTDPAYRLLCEEIFGPVVTAYVYDDAKWEETLTVVGDSPLVETSSASLSGRMRPLSEPFCLA